ncbi:hypothetical protein QFC22_005673 [Naganishia vaughanmartiniae]|uniref:Uncharacterized protein n=1 Tax=Naganishia vaughanmartiniae TaxID=1424756 RepID=A0ACC2WTT6_9TREE|nr:hypothetical protein QFC22_005673 [Naganishia vaughanmartiniae]
MFSSWNPFKRSQQEEGYTRDGQSGEQAPGIKIVVKFERDRYNIPIPNPSLTTVATLIQTLSTQIGIPTSQIKLIYNGAVLKSSSSTIASCGIKDGSTLVVVGANSIPSSGTADLSGGGSTVGVQQKKKKEVVPTTDEGLVEYVNAKASIVDELAKDVEDFQQNVNAYLASKKSGATPSSGEPVPTLTALHQTHMKLSELLLQGLLRLDSIDVPSHFTLSRAARKEAVRKVQGALNIVDGGWKDAKSAHGQASA